MIGKGLRDMEPDKRLIQLRIDIIERNLKEIRDILKLKKMRYRDELALKHALLESIEACIDIANHIIATKGFRRPTDYKDIFVVLEENKIVPKGLSRKLQEMAKFRNVLVHRYATVDMNKLVQIAKKDIKDVNRFLNIIIKKFL
ncbi:MAG: DUF86 domain-containing protein [Thermoprotei archaeon]|nr:MAG: DUF86 domain-containing protein [Thermoprotei archaeon]